MKGDIALGCEGAGVVLAFFQECLLQIVVNGILTEENAGLVAQVAFIGFVKEPDFQRDQVIRPYLRQAIVAAASQPKFADKIPELGVNNRARFIILGDAQLILKGMLVDDGSATAGRRGNRRPVAHGTDDGWSG